MNNEHKNFYNRIYSLDSISRQTVDDIIQETHDKSLNKTEFQDLVTKKIAQFHRSGYDIDSVEYLREEFEISRENKKIKKSVYIRGRNSMFQRLEIDEQKKLNELCELYSVIEKVENAKKNPFNRFIKWFNEYEQKRPVRANMAVSFTAFTLGDLMTQMAMKGEYTLRDLAIIGPLTLYYGWEIPKVIEIIDKKIPISSYKTSLNEWLDPKLLWRNLKRIRGEIYRNAAFNIYNLILWLPRHFAALEAKKDFPVEQTLDNLVTLEFAKNSTAVGIAQLPIAIAITHFIQNKIDLQYRFLALGAVDIVWSAIASFVQN